MKVINDPTVPGACSERQVLFYPIDWEDPLPATMEEIKIRIVNDRATGSKRERDEVTAVTPCSKRSRHAVFSCSTPLSASARAWSSQSKHAKEHPDFPAWHALQQNPEQDDEWDDSLLEPSDNEDDSPLFLTLDEIETLLDDDDEDDSCYAAEPSQNNNEMPTCVVTFAPSVSENEGENGGASPCKTLDIADTLTEEPECEGDVINYATMALSPCHLYPVEVIEQNQSSACNVKFPHEFLTTKTVVDSDLSTPLSDINEVSDFQLPNSCSPELFLQPSISLAGVDAAVNWSEDPDLAFDCDIDNLLAISPGAASSEEENGVELVTIATKGKSSVISDSTSPPPQYLESCQILPAHDVGPSSSDVAQHLSPLSLNTPGLAKVHHHPAGPESPKESLPFTTSSTVTTEPQLSTDPSGTKQTAESKKPSEAEEKKVMQNVESTSMQTDPSPSAAPRTNSKQSKNVTTSGCKAQGSSAPGKEKPRIAIAALPRPTFRSFLSDFELETNKQVYCNQVLMHVNGQGECNLENPHYELASLLNQTSRENQNWQHPSDFTKRNHPRFGKKPSKRCTLHQWATKNGGSNERFKNFPAIFQRSPIPDVLPYSSS
ncbi:S100P-binding protein isoform X2 [Rhinoderma darwinii]